MRIECAKCGHMHDSTVTPIPHDVVKPSESNEYLSYDQKVYAKYRITRFRCKKCGSINAMTVTWSVSERCDGKAKRNSTGD